MRGCWETAEREMNEWISRDKIYTNEIGVGGTVISLGSLKELNDGQKVVGIAWI